MTTENVNLVSGFLCVLIRRPTRMFRAAAAGSLSSVVVPLLLFAHCGYQKVCVDCISAAVVLRVEDAADHTVIRGGEYAFIKTGGDSLVWTDTAGEIPDSRSQYWSEYDTCVQFPGGPGNYTVRFRHQDYESFSLENIRVKPSEKYACDYAETKHLTVRVTKGVSAKRSADSGFTIVNDSEEGRCL